MKLVSSVVLLLGVAAFAGEPDPKALYDVSTEGSTTALKAGERGKLVLSIKSRGGAHVSDEAPLRIELSSKESKLDKAKLTIADSVVKKKEGETMIPDPRFEVGFAPSAQGPTSIDAKMTFFICTEKLCLRQTKTLSVPVSVN